MKKFLATSAIVLIAAVLLGATGDIPVKFINGAAPSNAPCTFTGQLAVDAVTGLGAWVCRTPGDATGAVWVSVMGGQRAAQPLPSSTDRQQASSGGIVANPYSTLIYDSTQLILGARGLARDDNGTMWGTAGNAPCTVGVVGCADATTDTIQTATIRDIAAAGATKYQRTTAVADTLDASFCRENASPFAACSNTGTCTLTIGGAHSIAGVLCAYSASTYGLCEPVGVESYSSCTANTSNLLSLTNSPLQEGTARYSHAIYDSAHAGELYYKMLAQSILNAPEELVYVPPVSLIANGGAVADCTGWTDTSGGAANAAAIQDPPFGGVNGSMVLRTCFSDAGEDLITPAMTTVAGRTYVARGYVRQNHTAAENLTITARAVDDEEVLTQEVYQVSGSVIQEWPSRVTTKARQCYSGCTIIVKFVAVDTSTEIIFSHDGAAYAAADSWIAYPSETDSLALNPLFPRYSLAGIRVEGDSRSIAANNGLIAAFDAALSTLSFPRPDLALEYPVESVSTAVGGRSLTSLIDTELYSTIDDAVPSSITLLFLGVNDMGAYGSSDLATKVRQVTRRIRQSGSRPLWIAEPTYRADTTVDYCAAGATNCGVVAWELIDLMQITEPEELH
jgi:hypothetical protein